MITLTFVQVRFRQLELRKLNLTHFVKLNNSKTKFQNHIGLGQSD